MLDDISLYWFTGAGTSSTRLYWEGVEALSEIQAFSQLHVQLPIK
jgi:hypothetical protein